MGYVYLLLSVAFEVGGMMAMKNSDGFQRIIPSILIFVCLALTYLFLTMTLQHLPMTLVYSVWAGVGTVAMALVSRVFYEEELSAVKFMAMGLIVAGVMLFQIKDQQSKQPSADRSQEKIETVESKKA